MKTYEFRDGDIVEVSPGTRNGGGPIPPFKGVVDSRRIPGNKRSTGWVWVRQLVPHPHSFSGGWYASQCRLVSRPQPRPDLPIPNNIIVGTE